MNICFIGYGNIAQAIIQGLQKDSQWRLFASSPQLPAGVNQQGVITHFNNKINAADADILILCVKPSQVASVLQEVTPVLSKNCLVISVAAGISLDYLATFSRANQALIRAMPNTPIAAGQGATALIANEWVTSQQKLQVESLFQASGITAWLPEENIMNAITALSGSGPAYVYLFIEALIESGTRLGLPTMLAQSFTMQTLRGALTLLETHDITPQQLRMQVTSPAGTTAAAVKILEDNQFKEAIFKAMQAACHRASELNNELDLTKRG